MRALDRKVIRDLWHLRGQVIAIDGKKLRRSHDKTIGKEAISMVSAWATANHLVLGQVKVESKSNEITAIPVLLAMLELTGCIVTVDAIGTQTEIAQQIVNQGGDYLLAVKENQPQLHEDIQLFFKLARHLTTGVMNRFRDRPRIS